MIVILITVSRLGLPTHPLSKIPPPWSLQSLPRNTLSLEAGEPHVGGLVVATQHGVQVELDLAHFLEEEECDECAWFEPTVQQYGYNSVEAMRTESGFIRKDSMLLGISRPAWSKPWNVSGRCAREGTSCPRIVALLTR